MPQVPEAHAKDNDSIHLIPTASVDLSPGDYVVMPRKSDPRSLALLGATPGRIRPISAAFHGQWGVGVVDGKFNTNIQGATNYAAPVADNAQRVIRKGVVRLAIVSTSGKAGDLVRYSSGASGAQLFDINNKAGGFAIGRIWKDFSGATANDAQYVELIELPLGGPNLYHYLENRVLDGCSVRVATQPSSQVMVGQLLVGTVPQKNLIVLQNRVYSIARDTALAMGGVGSLASSSVRFKWVVARSASFGIRSGSGSKAALASWTVAGVTIGLLTPVTATAGEFPIALLIQFSATTTSAARIRNVRGPNYIPNAGCSWSV